MKEDWNQARKNEKLKKYGLYNLQSDFSDICLFVSKAQNILANKKAAK